MMRYSMSRICSLRLDSGTMTATFLLHQLGTADVDRLTHYKMNHPSYSHLDWNSAERWYSRLDSSVFEKYFLMCRQACWYFVNDNPILLNLACYGRDLLVSNLSDDELQVFRDAKLLDKIPGDDVVNWWDRFKVDARRNLTGERLAQGRLAERWTIEEESRRLKEANIDASPEWVSLDSDRHGFDISSFRMLDGKVLPLLIEVKSFARDSIPHIYITLNEWKKARETIKGEYLFYIWSVEGKRYRILLPDDLVAHIPIDQGFGKWQSVLIDVAAFMKEGEEFRLA